jgi:hypothetical protein
LQELHRKASDIELPSSLWAVHKDPNGRFVCISDLRPNSILAMPKVNIQYERFEVFMTVIMKNAVFWDVIPLGSCKN